VLRQVDSGDLRSRPCEPYEVGAEPHADLEQCLAPRAFEIRELRDERLELVAPLLDLVEVLTRALGSLAVNGAAGLVLPELSDPALGLLGGGRRRGQGANRTVTAWILWWVEVDVAVVFVRITTGASSARPVESARVRVRVVIRGRLDGARSGWRSSANARATSRSTRRADQRGVLLGGGR
jgi:hypothetical protein